MSFVRKSCVELGAVFEYSFKPLSYRRDVSLCEDFESSRVLGNLNSPLIIQIKIDKSIVMCLYCAKLQEVNMKKIFTRFGLAYLAFPTLGILGFGSYAIFQQNLLLDFVIYLIATAIITSIALVIFEKKRIRANESRLGEAGEADLNGLEPSSNWNQVELDAWIEANQLIDTYLEKEPSIEGIKANTLSIVTLIANRCSNSRFNGELAFTAPEFLIMLEEVSKKYREHLLENIPFVDSVKVSTLKTCYDHKDTANILWNIYRAYRVTTPTGLISELRGMITSEIYDKFNDDLRVHLLKVLYQEVATVAIDLYGKKYDSKLYTSVSETSKKDKESISKFKIEPIRVSVVGEISSGKSSIINGLLGKVMSEVSVLPTTDKFTAYQYKNNEVDFTLVDSQGIDGSENQFELTLKEISKSDIVIFAVKANKPSKNNDIELISRVHNYYEANPKKKKPVCIMAITHADMVKGNEDAALEYNKSVFESLSVIDEYCLVQSSETGYEELKSRFIAGCDQALHVQFNRRRFDTSTIESMKSEAKRLKNALVKSLKIVIK